MAGKVGKRVVGVGGIFFKSNDPKAMNAWYSKHLGLKTNEYGALFEFRNAEIPDQKNYLQLSPFSQQSKYFEPSTKDFMINFRVDDLEALLVELKAEGVQQVGDIMREEYGLFAHILDPEGNKIELWQPIHDVFEKMAGDDTNR
jgi:predicted enzyme related to lactoylglutathione lyase